MKSLFRAVLGTRLGYWLLGCGIGFALFWGLGALVGRHRNSPLILGPVSFGQLALWFAERKGKLKPIEPERPITLFPRDRP